MRRRARWSLLVLGVALGLLGCAQILGVDGDAALLGAVVTDAAAPKDAVPSKDVLPPPPDADVPDQGAEDAPSADADAETPPPEDAGEDVADTAAPCDAAGDADACP